MGAPRPAGPQPRDGLQRAQQSRADSGRLRVPTGRLVVSRWVRSFAVAWPIVLSCALITSVTILVTPLAKLEAAPEGQVTWAFHVTLAPRWLDPGETESAITPFKILYAVHDALVKPMPAGLNTPSLAESWSISPDGATYEFVLRQNARFHTGDPVTADDVKFSFERYRGGAASIFKQRVREVQVVDPLRVRFQLTEPWPDFMTFYGTSASGAAWIVPKRYFEKVGDDGFKK